MERRKSAGGNGVHPRSFGTEVPQDDAQAEGRDHTRRIEAADRGAPARIGQGTVHCLSYTPVPFTGFACE